MPRGKMSEKAAPATLFRFTGGAEYECCFRRPSRHVDAAPYDTPPMPLNHRPLKHLLGYSLACASIHTDKIFREAIGAPLQLRQVEFTTLSLLDANKDVTASALSSALSVFAPNMSVILDRLEMRGLLKRVPHRTDKRASLLQLTAKGQTLVTEAAKRAAHMEDHLLGLLTPAELSMLMKLLDKVAAAPVPAEHATGGHRPPPRAAAS